MAEAVAANEVLELLRQLPPHDRLRVIAEALPEVEREISSRSAPRAPLSSLRGIWKDFGPAPSAEGIDQARRKAWANFPRDDI